MTEGEPATKSGESSYGTVMKILPLALATAALIASAPSHAQEAKEDYRVRVGLGGQLRPEFPGAKDREAAPYLDVDVARGDEPFVFDALDDSYGVALVNKNGFSFGPAANLQSGRKDKDVGLPLGKIDATIELGAFAEYYAGETFRLRGELLKGVNGHKGLVGSIGADRIWRDGDKYVVSVGPRLMVSDGRYQRAWFGVDPGAALASGLPAYRPGGGIYGVALASGASYQFNPKWGVFGYGRAERLVGDAARSPIVREIGSRNQISGGIGLSYTFRVKG